MAKNYHRGETQIVTARALFKEATPASEAASSLHSAIRLYGHGSDEYAVAREFYISIAIEGMSEREAARVREFLMAI